MKTKMIAGALLALGLAACGQQEQSVEATTAPAAAQEVHATETAPAESAAVETAPADITMDAPALEGATEETAEDAGNADDQPIE